MTIKVAIIHESEIVRKGLFSIIRQKANCEIMDVSKSAELNSLFSQKVDFLIVFCDIRLCDEEHQAIIQKKAKHTKNIIITNKPDSTIHSVSYDYQISLFSSSSEINSILDSCFKENDKNSDEHEGEELTIREKEVLKLVALGFSNKVIADKLFISIHTVISHRKNITEKLGIKSISGLTVYAILNNLLDTSEINPEDLI